MKKPVFPLFVLPLVMALACCGMNPVPGGDDASHSGDPVTEKPVGKRYYTLRLSDYGVYEDDTIGIGMGGTVSAAGVTPDPQDESRALTRGNAIASHEFFEAVFYHPASGTVARAAWNIGETPEIGGIYRADPPGTNYNNINVNGGPTNVNVGYAMLFVGTKDDKTLLALGRLCEVDGIGRTNTPPVPVPNITTETKSITFEVAPLTAGVRRNIDIDGSDGRAKSSFWTSYRAGSNSSDIAEVSETNTEILDEIYIHYVDKKKFPFFRVNRNDASGYPGGHNDTTRGEYNFKVDATGAVVTPTTFDLYKAGIVLAGGFNCELRNPRYVITDGLYQYSSIFVQDKRIGTNVMNQNIQPAGYLGPDGSGAPSYFVNPVPFQFVTTNSPDGSIFALVFEIFVYNLTGRLTTKTDIPDRNPVKWRISPGYGTKWLDLDDGLGGEGGAILLGSGSVETWIAPYNTWQ